MLDEHTDWVCQLAQTFDCPSLSYLIICVVKKVRSLVLLKDGFTMASASYDKTIKLWDTDTGEVESGKTLQEHTESVWSLGALEDGRLVSSSEDSSIIIWK